FLRFIYRLGVRPNYITLVSIPCGLLGVVLLFQGDMLSGFLIPLYIVLDVLDGSLARVTGSVSEFGDKLDFLGDRAVASLFLILFYVNGGDALFSITGLILISAVTLEDLGLIKRRTK
ncbi:MAG: CDP-alcohol phosphatidyltransferase family protein, partial [Candidatus Altiarchaeota archaeon]|nr:CDP-alcohol phosphatidyltransferase family protein [Candidatus Altiarchaeota archaeon]